MTTAAEARAMCLDCKRAPSLESEPVCLDCALERDADDHDSWCDCDVCWRRRHDATSVVRPRSSETVARGGLSQFGREVLGWAEGVDECDFTK